jgi:hypothetical protein
VSNQCTNENSDLWTLDLNNNDSNPHTTTTFINQKVVYITLDDALASFQNLFSNFISINDNNSGDPSSGMQRVSALRYKWVDNNNNSSSSVAIVDNDNDSNTSSNNNIACCPTLDVGSATQQLYT